MSLSDRFWSSDRSLSALLLLLCLEIFVIRPLRDLGMANTALVALFFSLFLISGVGAVAKSSLATLLVGAVVVIALTVRWLRFWFGGDSLVVLNECFAALFCAVLAIVVLMQVFREGPITSYRIQGAVAVYLLLGLGWAFAYTVIDLHWPGAFVPAAPMAHDDLSSRFMYFSFVTLTTTGYGDIAAVHPVARSLVSMEALAGQLFPAILLARLVSMELYFRQGWPGDADE